MGKHEGMINYRVYSNVHSNRYEERRPTGKDVGGKSAKAAISAAEDFIGEE